MVMPVAFVKEAAGAPRGVGGLVTADLPPPTGSLPERAPWQTYDAVD